MSATLTGILGKFEIDVDLLEALTAVTSGDFRDPQRVQRPRQLQRRRRQRPRRDPERGHRDRLRHPRQLGPELQAGDHGGAAQTLLTVQDAQVTFPAFGVSAQIMRQRPTIPGLTVRTDGFKLGEPR